VDLKNIGHGEKWAYRKVDVEKIWLKEQWSCKTVGLENNCHGNKVGLERSVVTENSGL